MGFLLENSATRASPGRPTDPVIQEITSVLLPFPAFLGLQRLSKNPPACREPAGCVVARRGDDAY